MTGWEYLGAVVVSLGAMLLVDHRWRLFLWDRPRRAAVVLACGILLFLLWDVAGITTGIFERGDSPAMSGIEVAPDLPLEELFFVTFLCYLTMVVHGLVARFVLPDRGVS
ncbi:lycopene cyclase domain-containing protein [Sanguibacter antarcticus]|uniref:Lycopene cyclase domain-containing protein n=1 Tax=Sanguibacter antarcticus TaxID=372484 RepID=A0A2A9E1D8_9MICO|nr:lycopene cyclase domain-containing protein [Sanguibacter antarcticus]PFG32758.1 lycopene cyclase domain-containing protein [Sanguibacter antarcticus]